MGAGKAMMDIYIVICEDRHSDIDVKVFLDPDRAIEYAKNSVLEDWDVREQALTEAMKRDGWIFLVDYGTENDCVRVERGQLNTNTVLSVL